MDASHAGHLEEHYLIVALEHGGKTYVLPRRDGSPFPYEGTQGKSAATRLANRLNAGRKRMAPFVLSAAGEDGETVQIRVDNPSGVRFSVRSWLTGRNIF